MLYRVTIALALAFAPAPLVAQAIVQPIGVSDADALAEQVRRLGSNPLDVDALLTAAELSLRLDDLSAAGAFLARADKVAASGARGAAIRGAILVRSERPGEALRQFAQAETAGVSPARFAADRGLAYDLIGDQPRAQRNYRLALREGGGNDETRRRLALSLGISGQQREALDEIAPAVRRNDRAAWRTRAFVLAMGGDAIEASRIASTMMPPGSAQGLRDFFAELPRLSAVDRAFAVHFGEVRPTPARFADARLAPQLPPLPAETPVQIAAAAPATAAVSGKGKRKGEKVPPGRVSVTYAPIPTPVQIAAETPSQPPAYQAPAYQPPVTALAATPKIVAANTADRPLTPGEQASLAAATLRLPSHRGRSMPAPSAAAQANLAIAAGPVMAASAPRTAQTGVTLTPLAPLITPPLASPVVLATHSSAPAIRSSVAAPTGRSPRAGRGEGDDVLARIVANLSIPATELGVAKAAPAAGRSSRPTDTRTASADTALTPAERRAAAKAAAAEQAADAKLTPAQRRAAAKKALADKAVTADPPTPAERRAAAKKVVADKKAAAEKKALAAQEAAEKKAARAEPSRIWVQVAGGANAGDLGKAWNATRAKATTAFAGRKAYTTPSGATNRVLTGPFKTSAEARAYVNQLAKTGVSAFSFTSEAGQKVSRLDAK